MDQANVSAARLERPTAAAGPTCHLGFSAPPTPRIRATTHRQERPWVSRFGPPRRGRVPVLRSVLSPSLYATNRNRSKRAESGGERDQVEPKSGRHRTARHHRRRSRAFGVCGGGGALSRSSGWFRWGSSAPARCNFHGGRLKPDSGGRCGGASEGHGEEEEEAEAEAEMVVCSMRKSFKDSLKVLEADIQHANTLAADFSRDYDGACLQMRMSYSPAAQFFLFLVQWTDCSLAGALGLLRILIYKGISDVDDRRQKAVFTERYRRRDEDESKRPVSEIDVEREEECGICMEMNNKVVLPTCSHAMCMKCYRQWRSRSQSCPFCRDSLKRVNSGDLWMFTDCRDVVDMATVTRENIRRLFMYIDKLPLVTPENIFYAYDSHVK
ncbi:zinc finger Ring-type domain-containing protein [Panicum miliaceum]|uniref:Zinc finger Ring-type domain-containing protein n=1 Tax=Panicum miliaceum TaxID=4540 RepID=A0A3L6PW47_PANMI|nr:zinc finger Ring-type domain-containing protein [Panicum miliaceum]